MLQELRREDPVLQSLQKWSLYGQSRSEQSGGARAGERRKEARNADGGSDCDGQYPIMGQSSVTTEQMVSYFQSSGKAYPAESLAKERGGQYRNIFAGFM